MDSLKHYQPTEAELAILQVLWEHQPCTVRFVHEHFAAKGKAVGYTTILKTMQRMDKDKGLLNRDKSGKTHYYSAVPKEAEVQQTLFQRLKNTAFKGSAMKMILHALGQDQASPEELAEIRAFLDKKRAQEE